MSEMSRHDAELVYKHINDRVRTNIEVNAYDIAFDEFEDVDVLETADNDSQSSFTWDGITYEFHRTDRDHEQLIPLTGVEPNEEPEVYEVANEFGWLVVENIREEVRRLQEQTMFSPREFVALVLASEFAEEDAATLMDISIGTFRGKKGRISEKIESAKQTLTQAEQIRGD